MMSVRLTPWSAQSRAATSLRSSVVGATCTTTVGTVTVIRCMSSTISFSARSRRGFGSRLATVPCFDQISARAGNGPPIETGKDTAHSPWTEAVLGGAQWEPTLSRGSLLTETFHQGCWSAIAATILPVANQLICSSAPTKTMPRTGTPRDGITISGVTLNGEVAARVMAWQSSLSRPSDGFAIAMPQEASRNRCLPTSSASTRRKSVLLSIVGPGNTFPEPDGVLVS